MKQEYKEALDYLFSQLPMFSRTGAPAYKPGLDTSIQLAEYFGNPQDKFKSIHIGGTNGKGSTSHMIAAVLQSQGYKVGLYTSPHLVDFRERIRINGEMIPEEKVVQFVSEWKKTGYSGHPSFFELTMIMALDWFAQEKVDYAVVEVGMGGRLDSTNIITPLLSVITNISHDHNQFLGDTLEKIAGEKAGIIKKGIPVVIGETQKETEKIFKTTAEDQMSEIIFADKEKNLSLIDPDNGGWNCKFNQLEFSLPLGGDYQKKNIRTVIASILKLREQGIKIDDDSIIKGIENVVDLTGLMGRWMIINEKPLTIADTGHNIAGMEYNVSQLIRLQKEKGRGNLRILIGFVADKAIDKILAILPKEAEYYVTNAQIPRAMGADKLLDKFLESGFKAKSYPDVATAYEVLKKETSDEDIVFIGGSTFIVADLLHYLYVGRDS